MKRALLILFLLGLSAPASAAYYAELDKNNTVIRVIVIEDNGDEATGIAACVNLFKGGTWVKTQMDGSMRKNYAGPGYTYNPGIDAFAAPQPFPSWTLDNATATWQAPIAKPVNGQPQAWDEKNQVWVAVTVGAVDGALGQN